MPSKAPTCEVSACDVGEASFGVVHQEGPDLTGTAVWQAERPVPLNALYHVRILLLPRI